MNFNSLFWDVSPIRVQTNLWPELYLFVGRWAACISLRRGTPWWLGWSNWKKDAGAMGPCYELCSCRVCWNGWKTFPFRIRLNWRLYQIWRDFRRIDPGA